MPSLPRGRWCSPRPDAVPDRHLPLHNGQSLHPTDTTHLRGSALRDINEGSRDSPVRSAPNLWPPDGTRTLRRSLKLRTPPSPAAHVKGGAKTRARARNYATDTMSALQSASPLAKCNLVSQRQLRMFFSHACVSAEGPEPALHRRPRRAAEADRTHTATRSRVQMAKSVPATTP